jgi:two-component system cell cycle sensor histidine kinase/response regulator CckA
VKQLNLGGILMLRARGSDAAEHVVEIKRPRSSFPQLAFVLVSTVAVMTLFEVTKSLVFPALTLWQSHLITIVVSSIVATTAASFVLRKLRHSEDTYHRLVGMSPDAVWVHRQGTIIDANTACAKMFGVSSPAELLGKHVLDFVHPDDRDAVRLRIQNHLDDSNLVRHYETKSVHADGGDFDVEVLVCSILHQGEAATLVMFHDISERKKAEHRLRESEANLAGAQRIAHLGSWELALTNPDDLNRNSLHWSDETFRIFGYEVGQIEVSRPNFLRAVHPADRDRVNDATSEAIRERTAYSLEFRVIRPDGSERLVVAKANTVCDEKTGKPLRFEGTLQDITERKHAEEKLARLALIVESSDDAISSVALDGTITSWNKGAERIYGYSASEVLGKPIGILEPHDRPNEIGEILERLRKGERIQAFETVRIRKGRRPVDVSLTISPVKDPNGQIIGTAAIAQDITAHKREEERSRRLAQLVDNATELISTGDREGRITFMNQAYLRAVGWSEEEIIGKYYRDVVLSPNVSPGLREQIWAGIVETGGWKGECLFRRKNGTDFPVYLSVGPLKDSAGRVIGNVGIVRDITESKRAEERFYKAFHLNPEPITIATVSEGRYLDVNESFLRITGYQRHEVIGRTSLEVKFWERTEDRDRLIERLRQQGSVRDLEITFRTKSGGQRVALDSADVIEVDGQRCIIAILKDITERKALEKQLRQLQKMEAVGQLSGGIAHDFNNLLGVILGYSEILEDGLDQNAKLRKTAQEIKKAGQRAASLTRQLLAFSRQQVLEPRVLNLNNVVADTERMLRRLIGEHIEMTSKLTPDLGQVKADQGQIEQVIMNLALNARDAMPDGGKLIIETKNIELDEEFALQHPPTIPGKYVELLMTDTGVGMDAQTQSHIFEPFFTTKELGKGTGLGLATVYGVVKQSGGYVWVYSEPGLGSTFRVYLPRVDEAAGHRSRSDVETTLARGSETILLVEDEESLRTLTRVMLEQNGYTVLEANGGKEAIELARRHGRHIDLLLTDMVMPGMSGRTVARTLAQVRPEMKVVYMSGYTGFAEHGLPASDEILLPKPITRDTLLRKLREVLRLQKTPVV